MSNGASDTGHAMLMSNLTGLQTVMGGTLVDWIVREACGAYRLALLGFELLWSDF